MRSWVAILPAIAWLWAQAALSQPPNPELAFADVFASVLVGENPDGGAWSEAGNYLDAA